MKKHPILQGIICLLLSLTAAYTAPTIGVLAERDAQAFVAPFELALARQPGIALVERENLDPVLDEQASASAGFTLESSLRTGKLVDADALLVISGSPQKGAIVRLVNVKDGFVEWQVLGPQAANWSGAPPLPQPVADFVNHVSARIGSITRVGDSRLLVSVPVPQAKFAGVDSTTAAEAVHARLLHGLSRDPSIAVLERLQLEALAWEGALSSNIADPKAASVVIRSELSHPPADPQQLVLTLQLDAAGREPVTIEVTGERDAPAELGGQAVARICEALGAEESAPDPAADTASTKAEAAQLAREAISAERWDLDHRYVDDRAETAWYLGHRDTRFTELRARGIMREAAGFDFEMPADDMRGNPGEPWNDFYVANSFNKRLAEEFEQKPDLTQRRMQLAAEALELLAREMPPLEAEQAAEILREEDQKKKNKKVDKKKKVAPWRTPAVSYVAIANAILCESIDRGALTEYPNDVARLRNALLALSAEIIKPGPGVVTRTNLATIQVKSAGYWADTPEEVAKIQTEAFLAAQEYDNRQTANPLQVLLLALLDPGTNAQILEKRQWERAFARNEELTSSVRYVAKTRVGPEAFSTLIPEFARTVAKTDKGTYAERARNWLAIQGLSEASGAPGQDPFWEAFKESVAKRQTYRAASALWSEAYARNPQQTTNAILEAMEAAAGEEQVNWPFIKSSIDFLAGSSDVELSRAQAIRILKTINSLVSSDHPYWAWAEANPAVAKKRDELAIFVSKGTGLRPMASLERPVNRLVEKFKITRNDFAPSEQVDTDSVAAGQRPFEPGKAAPASTSKDAHGAPPADAAGGTADEKPMVANVKFTSAGSSGEIPQVFELSYQEADAVWAVRRPDFELVRFDLLKNEISRIPGPAPQSPEEEEGLLNAKVSYADPEFVAVYVMGDFLPWRLLLLNRETGEWERIGGMPPLVTKWTKAPNAIRLGSFLYAEYEDPGRLGAKGLLRLNLGTGKVDLLTNSNPGSDKRMARHGEILLTPENEIILKIQRDFSKFDDVRGEWVPYPGKLPAKAKLMFDDKWLLAKDLKDPKEVAVLSKSRSSGDIAIAPKLTTLFKELDASHMALDSEYGDETERTVVFFAIADDVDEARMFKLGPHGFVTEASRFGSTTNLYRRIGFMTPPLSEAAVVLKTGGD